MPAPLHRPLAPVRGKRGRVEPCGFEVVPIENPGEWGDVGVPLEGWEAGTDLGVPREGQEMGQGQTMLPRAAPQLLGCSQAKLCRVPQ